MLIWNPRTLYDSEFESEEMVLDCRVWGQDSVMEMSQLLAGCGSWYLVPTFTLVLNNQ